MESRPNEPDVAIIKAGQEPGTADISLIPADPASSAEYLRVIVKLSLEDMIRRIVPTSNVKIHRGNSATGIPKLTVTGFTTNAEDVNLIIRLAENEVGLGNVVNALHVGGVQQVQLDCVVAVVSRTKLRNMSFDFLNQGNNHTLASTIGGAIVGPTATMGVVPSALVQTNTIGTPNGLPANVFLGLFNDQQVFFSYLQILKNEQMAKLLAEPRLVTMSGHVATFLAGGQQAVPSPGGLGAVSVQFVPFGTQLNFLPIVLGNGKIYLEVSPSVSNLDSAAGSQIAGFFVQGRTTQTIHTTVLMEDGQTFVIGGLIQNQISGSSSKIPVLGDLPWIGAAFRSQSFREQENEIVVMVTPHLVDPLSCAQVPKVLPGQETRSPDDFELFLEGILEAPRGPRPICPNRRYTPAYKSGPTAAQFPCGIGGGCGVGGCAPAACANGACATTSGTSGLGLADASSVSYPGIAPALTPEKTTAVSTTQTVGAAAVNHSAESQPTSAEKASGADAVGSAGKPPFFGSNLDHGNK